MKADCEFTTTAKMCQASQMSEGILSEDIELTENVRQEETIKEKEKTGAHVFV